MIQLDDHIFQTGWFNHQLDMSGNRGNRGGGTTDISVDQKKL